MTYLCCLFLALASIVTNAGNGSSGTGTGTAMITNTIGVVELGALLEVKGDLVFNKSTLQALVKVTPVVLSESSGLVKTKLGEVKGYEFIPSINSGDESYWVVCEKSKKQDCFRLDSLDKTDKLVPSLLGSLRYLSKKDKRKSL
jgi:hypothetical protein